MNIEGGKQDFSEETVEGKFSLTPEQEKIFHEIKNIIHVQVEQNTVLKKDNNFTHKLDEKKASLREKYPDRDRYYLYHCLIFSTFDPADCIAFDFPGEDSVELFFKDNF